MSHRRVLDQARRQEDSASRWIQLTVALGFALSCVSGCLQASPPSSIEQSVSLLVGLLKDPDAETRRTAAESLGKIGDRTAVPFLIALTTDPSPLVRSAGIKAIGRLGSDALPDVVPHVLRALEDEHDSVRRAAIEAVGELDPPPGLLRALSSLLISPEVRTRRAAALSLVPVDASMWTDVLARAVLDPDARVRQGAVAALGEVGSSGGLASIRGRVLFDADPAVRAEAAYRLRLTADEETRRILNRVAESDPDRVVRRWATE